MGLQRFPYKKFEGINTSDGPFDLPTGKSPDCVNVVPRDYLSLEGLTHRQGSAMFLQEDVAGGGFPLSFGSFVTGVGPLDGALLWPGPNKFVFSDQGDITQVTGQGGNTAIIFAMTPVTQIWTFAIAPDVSGAEKVWCMPTNALTAAAAAPQKWDGVAATTSAWAGSPPNVSLPSVANANISKRPGGILYWKNRMLVWNAAGFKARLFFSDKGNPESPTTGNYGPNNFIDFLDDDSSEGITQCLSHQESLLVFREKGIWQVFNPTTFDNKRLVVGQGTGYRYQAVSHPNGRVYFISVVDEQIYSISLKGDLVCESKDIRYTLTNRTGTQKYLDQLLLSPKGSIILKWGGTAQPGIVWELIPSRTPGDGTWWKHQFSAQALNYWFNAGSWSSNEQIILGNLGSSGTSIYEYFRGDAFSADMTDATSFGDSIMPTPYWVSSWRPFISQEPVERLRRFHLVGHGTVALDFYAEPQPVVAPTAKVSVPFFAIGEAGTGGSPSFPFSRGFTTHRPETRGRYHAFKIRGNSAPTPGIPWVIDEAEFVFRGGKEHVQ